MSTVIIMAGGTGGHIYPALAVGTALRERGVNVCWMGVHDGLESRLARDKGFEFDPVRTRGLWGKGFTRWLTMPLWLSGVDTAVHRHHFATKTGCAFGNGWLRMRSRRSRWLAPASPAGHSRVEYRPPALTNRVLAVLASRVLTGFSDTKLAGKPIWVGTPVRDQIIEVGRQRDGSDLDVDRPLNLLVIGGSQGALALNECGSGGTDDASR